MYQVEFGGKVTELTTNVIAESMYTQSDLDDCQRNKKGISLTDQQITLPGRSGTHKTTAGWQICCQWKDCSTSWEKLSKLKESHPVQTAEFAVMQVIDHEPTFNWWVKHVL